MKHSDGKNKGNVGIYTFCNDGKSRNYCCPKGQDMPTCRWRGRAPFCNGKCEKGEVQVASDTSATGAECWTGHKVLCCTSTASDSAIGQCKWEGSAPFCGKHGRVGEHAGCDESDRYEETFDSLGSGGESYCFSGYKSFCCTKPPPFSHCAWTSKDHPWLHPFTCSAGCPPGQEIIATDPTKAGICDSGSSYYCCDAPTKDVPDSDDDLAFCDSTDGDYVLSIDDTKGPSNYDDDGNPADILELYWYENEVFVSPNDASPDDIIRRDSVMDQLASLRHSRDWGDPSLLKDNTSLPQVCTDYDCFFIAEPDLPEVQILLGEIRESWESTLVKHGEDVHGLVERSRTRTSTVKLPKNKRVRFVASTYYTVAELSGKGRKFWANGAGKATAICIKNAAAFQARKLASTTFAVISMPSY